MADISFQTLLEDYVDLLRQPRVVVTAAAREDERAALCGDLNAAARWWWGKCGVRALPAMLTGKTVTLASGGKVTAADIEGSTFWSVWQSDPRAEVLMDREWARLRLEGSALSNGDIQVRGGVAGGTVFVFYKKPVPRWTVVSAVATTNYASGSRIWWDNVTLAGAPPDGHVYVNIAATPSGSDDIADPTLWQTVVIDDTLQEIVLRKANYERMRLGSKVPDAAGREREELLECIDDAWISAQPQFGKKPWLNNYNI